MAWVPFLRSQHIQPLVSSWPPHPLSNTGASWVSFRVRQTDRAQESVGEEAGLSCSPVTYFEPARRTSRHIGGRSGRWPCCSRPLPQLGSNASSPGSPTSPPRSSGSCKEDKRASLGSDYVPLLVLDSGGDLLRRGPGMPASRKETGALLIAMHRGRELLPVSHLWDPKSTRSLCGAIVATEQAHKRKVSASLLRPTASLHLGTTSTNSEANALPCSSFFMCKNPESI